MKTNRERARDIVEMIRNTPGRSADETLMQLVAAQLDIVAERPSVDRAEEGRSVKIISKPDADNYRLRVTCMVCSTVVDAELSDLTFHSDSRDGDYVAYTCPTCGRSCAHAVDQVPRHLHHAIKRGGGA